MIEIKNGQIIYNNSHLGKPKIEKYSGIIKRLENLNTDLFYNIISSPNCRYEANFGFNRTRPELKKMTPNQRFENILKSKKIFGSPKGYFVNKNRRGIKPMDISEIKSTSFTLSDIHNLDKHFKARNSEFGICFNHDYLQNKGIRPVVYLNDNDKESKEKFIFNSPHLLEVYNNKYDMRWENEWRVTGDLDFEHGDIAFVIVPYSYYDYYVNYFLNEGLDNIPIVTSSTYNSHLEHFLQIPFMDNSWKQIRLFDCDGPKTDPYSKKDLTISQYRDFSIKYYKELECLAKNTILNIYESRYIKRFLSFFEKIDSQASILKSFKFDNYILNKDEPEDSERDLIMHLHTRMYMHLN